jgi:hypothetical protein
MRDVMDLHLDEGDLGRLPARREIGVSGDRGDLDPEPFRRLADRSQARFVGIVEHRQMRPLARDLDGRIAQRRGLFEKLGQAQAMLAPVTGVAHGEEDGGHDSVS